MRELEARLQELRELSSQRERELELLEYELAEIDASAPDESEHERLLAARERLRRLDALCAAAGAGAEALAPERRRGRRAPPSSWRSAAAGWKRSPASTRRSTRWPSGCARWCSSPRTSPASCAGYCERAAPSGLRYRRRAEHLVRTSLEALEARLAAVERLVRKHGGSVGAVLEYASRPAPGATS